MKVPRFSHVMSQRRCEPGIPDPRCSGLETLRLCDNSPVSQQLEKAEVSPGPAPRVEILRSMNPPRRFAFLDVRFRGCEFCVPNPVRPRCHCFLLRERLLRVCNVSTFGVLQVRYPVSLNSCGCDAAGLGPQASETPRPGTSEGPLLPWGGSPPSAPLRPPHLVRAVRPPTPQ